MKRLFFAKYGYMTLSVLFFLAGLAYMFLPDLPEMAVCLMLGILLIVYGAVKLVGYLATVTAWRSSTIWHLPSSC